MRRPFLWLALASAALVPQTAFAWGAEGHEIVGLIALKHLDPRVQATVNQMLADDPDHLTAPDIADAANWADRFRDSDRNTTQIRYRLTREWHFVDLELDNPDVSAACFGHPPAAVPASKGPANSCVVDRISAFQSELSSLPSTDPERVVALKFILHFVGDVHQPLHAADHDDQGGNKAMVLYGDGTIGTPLRGFWDTEVVKRLGHESAAVAETLDQKFGGRCSKWMTGSPTDWAQESFELARDKAYNLGQQTSDSRGNPAYKLSSRYQAQALTAAGEQLAKAGCRLAMVLNRSVQ